MVRSALVGRQARDSVMKPGAENRLFGRARWSVAVALALGLLSAPDAWSVPAFARAMGVPCASCHTLAFGPALTPFGRYFKLHSYALGTQRTIPVSADMIAS